MTVRSQSQTSPWRRERRAITRVIRRTALLVVEISDTTLGFDRSRKRELYARAGIQEYWIVNLLDCRVEVYRFPRGGDYTHTSAFDSSGTLTALAAPQAPIHVADLLP